MTRLAPALGVTPQELFATDVQVPIVGYVGAGAEIFSIDDHAKGAAMDYISAPDQGAAPSTVALIVRGDSMLPVYKAGDVIGYDEQLSGADLVQLVGKRCVVRLIDGRTYVKKLQITGGRYWLVSHNAEPIVDPSIEWAAKVLWVKYGE